MKHTTEVMISAEEISQKLDQMAEQINAHYANSERLLMVGLLKGSVVFMADLCAVLKAMLKSILCRFELCSRDVKVLKDVQSRYRARDVLIVEDLIDSGNTLNKVREMLGCKSRLYPVFNYPDEFIVGYGIDYAEQYRNLPYIAKVVPLE
ncbi:unnamed protein product [Ranitomeya imitator]|uniref:Phosphoribosyltransferase domain-containing protein n=1 Tax=Ranitomeya imitator TaxID=111125 RepID=A0ABN9MLW4_9NEOB|nr:unnamed protein product [Ranitomeya imitator]